MSDTVTAIGDGEAPPPDESVEEFRRQLRRRWELASILHFLSAFEAVLGKEVKMSAEKIEDALITPDDSLAKLHTILLKGIGRVYDKQFLGPDAWVTVLCKRLAEWWHWVAEGELPLSANKGEEISKYKELDPTVRLLMLKALCEVRAEQDDLASYINDALKEGVEVSHFRKDKICANKTRTYWYDGDPVIGYRLYKEVNKFQPKSSRRGKEYLYPVSTNLEWETIATNLEEFRKVSGELSSSASGDEGVLYETIETEIIPVLEKLQKKKERISREKQRKEENLNYGRAAGIIRSTRNRKPVNYSCEDYDRTMREAIKLGMSRGTDGKVGSNDRKRSEHGKKYLDASGGDSRRGASSDVGSPTAIYEDSEKSRQHEGSDAVEYISSTNNNDTNDDVKDSYASELENGKTDRKKHVDNKMLIGCGLDNPYAHYPQPRNPRAKNRLRQRPTQNSVFNFVVSDTDDGNSSDSLSIDASSKEAPLEVPDSEDESR